jgi:hypothetical protein
MTVEPGTEPNAAPAAALQAAADDLADRLKALAVRLASEVDPQRYEYGPGRLGSALRRRSPEGFHTGTQRLHILLPDGRLWLYSRSDWRRFPDGRFYDPRTDYTQSSARSYPGGTPFTFLGAVLGKHTFGFVEREGSTPSSGLCSLVAEEGPVHFMEPDDAFADLAESILGYLKARQD